MSAVGLRASVNPDGAAHERACAELSRVPRALEADEREDRSGPIVWLALILLLLGLCWASGALGAEPPATDQVSVGAGVVLSERAAVVPVAIVAVDAPAYLGASSAARIFATLKIHGTQGAAVNIADAATFRGAELDVYVQRRIGADRSGGSTYLHAHGGGAVRQDSDTARPALRTPLWWDVGLTLERREGKRFPHRRLSVGVGHSDLSSPPLSQPGTLATSARDAIPRDLIVSGHVTVTAVGGVRVIIGGEAHRALWGVRGTQSVRLTTSATWGRAS